jgi:hypothetical protein
MFKVSSYMDFVMQVVQVLADQSMPQEKDVQN